MEQPITVGCLESCDWLLHSFIEVNFNGQQSNFQEMISFAFIITSVKFQFKLISEQFFRPIISCSELSITLSTGYTNSYWYRTLEQSQNHREKNFLVDFIE